MSGAADVQQLMDRVAGLVEEAEQAGDPVARQRAKALVAAVLELHGLALARLPAVVGPGAFEACALDPVIGSVLLVHDLHPHPLERRVRSVLPDGVTLVSADRGTVRVRAPSGTPRRELERAIADVAPDAEQIVVDVAFQAPPCFTAGQRR